MAETPPIAGPYEPPRIERVLNSEDPRAKSSTLRTR
jgi:hypothetical protein